jgi:hypothetical protein
MPAKVLGTIENPHVTATYQHLFSSYLQGLPENLTAPQCMVILSVDLLDTPSSAILGMVSIYHLELLQKCLAARIEDIKQRGINVI